MAEKIEVSKIISKLNDNEFFEAKKHLKKYLNFYYLECKSSSKALLVEKIYDQIECIKIKNNVTFGKLLYFYMDEMLSLMNGKVEKNSRAAKYFIKAKEIVHSSKKSDKFVSQRNVDDLTRIALCLYSSYLKKGKPISNFSFNLKDVDYKAILSEMTKEEKGILPIIGKDTKNAKYSKESFVFIFMTLIYFRIMSNAPKCEE